MRRIVLAVILVSLLTWTSPAVINVKLTADKTALNASETTTIHVLGQGTAAGLYGLGGTITATGSAGLLVSNTGTLAWVAAFHAGDPPLDSKLGTPGANGAWSTFGSMQTNFLHPDATYGKADYVELASYTVTAQAGDGTVTLSFASASVPGFPLVETDSSSTPGTFTPLSITVGNPSAGILTVSPAGGLISTGTVGGPFTPASITYTLTNTGASAVNWTAGKAQTWVSLSKSSGTLAAGANDTVVVSFAAAANSLAVGSYTDTVTFTNTTNGNGNATRAVSLTVNAAPGQLAVSPAGGLTGSGSVGGPFSPTGVSYTLSNPGPSAINWTAGKGQPWVSLSKASGTLAAGANDTVVVSFAATANSLAAGNYTDTVTFTNTTNGMGNTTRAVSLAVSGQPGQLMVTPSTGLSSSGAVGGPFSPATIAYLLTNIGGTAINWTAGKTQSWVGLSLTGGTLASGAAVTVDVSILGGANALVAGTYTDTVTFANTTNGTGSTTRAVSLTIAPAGQLAGQMVVSPFTDLGSSGNVGGTFTPASATYTLSNPGTASLDWTAGKTQPWISLSKTSGTLAVGATDTVTVLIGASASSLAIGNYGDTVTFTNTTNGVGNTTRTVSLAVAAAGQLAVLSSGGLSSSGAVGGPFSPANVTYTLSNPGGTTISWTAGKTQSWAGLSLTGGTLAPGATVTVDVSIAAGANALALGTYTDTVTFTNTTNGAGNTTRAVSLTVQAVAQAALSIDPHSRSVDKNAGSATFAVSNAGGGSLSWSSQVTSGGDWLTITSGGGTNTGTITVSYAANAGGQRVGQIRVTAAGALNSPTDLTVTQAANDVTPGLPQITVASDGINNVSIVGAPTIYSGATLYTFTAQEGETFSLTAPLAIGDYKFQYWLKDDAIGGDGVNILQVSSVTGNHRYVATYAFEPDVPAVQPKCGAKGSNNLLAFGVICFGGLLFSKRRIRRAG